MSPSDVLETAELLNIEITNYDLVTPEPEKEASAGDPGTEYFEADDEDADIIKVEDDSEEDIKEEVRELEKDNADIHSKIADLIRRKRAFVERMRTGQEEGVSVLSKRQQRQQRRETEREKKEKKKKKRKKNDCQQCPLCKQRFQSREKLIIHLWHVHKGDLMFN